MAISNGLNPNLNRVEFNNGTAVITGGIKTGHFDILADVGGTGAIGPGSIYISSVTNTGEVWILQNSVWTKLTVN